ncbi:UDP-2,4-diacetamido-2,4,6-trideoxy-beta-L-altropyranose hydrolase [Anoxybacillus voinovskiensis]|uniref:UDP-2,4-diacetamido-2,4, 6-trideoxy-beta-L-altropyranose hydrolase n=1 Tax=Anoxybacteroides voinovskiense TaxID=230470 RepID=A0A840DL02_9BACL|nr:UDP-2,4-diacetamido-2,4,6-trideoxy-beta-L-altropyranose hydrolase [Anoxybacillus voinovskiensis]MBB4073744.1 UDP-2,4-diacetamido-2,4,6-trideoxy-beta-L-altropyranose hydrolase [Anoxybacillus voinovskiensis]GGJ64245.1 UDP-2,4-diacetamido-2,4,6-trideoxy-beta-L-altropyranose hydrolase [Anoxybacillus voinovskiensis]
MMNIFFRVDASIEIGTGHVMRCLTLADELKKYGNRVMFICRMHKGHLCNFIESKGYEVARLPQIQEEIEWLTPHSHWLGAHWLTDVHDTIQSLKKNAPIDWLIIDHYGIEENWQKEVRPYVKKIMVIDDLADRKHDCDLLLDQNYYAQMENRYRHLVKNETRLLLGPKYALIREEFKKVRLNLKERNGEVKRIVVFLGGSDPHNVTELVLEALKIEEFRNIEVNVIVGTSNIHKERIQNICSQVPRFHFHCQINNMAELMATADLAIGAGGTAIWERCYLGLPSLVIILASNQEQVIHALEWYGAVYNLGYKENICIEHIVCSLKKLINNKKILRDMSRKCRDLFGESLGNELVVSLLKGDSDVII